MSMLMLVIAKRSVIMSMRIEIMKLHIKILFLQF